MASALSSWASSLTMGPRASIASCPPIRILLIGDQPMMRAGLRMLIESRPGLKVVAEADTLAASAAASREQTDIIVLDFDQAAGDGPELLRELTQTAPDARVLVLTGSHDAEVHRRAVGMGAVGVLLKEHPAEVLIQAIEKVHAGEAWLEGSLVARLLGEITRRRQPARIGSDEARIASLTAREMEVIALIGEGLRNKQIAKRLFISETTVRHHLTAIFDKLEVADRLELVVYAYRHGLRPGNAPR
jgi:two-component system, NarL family, nitrate/nitrite response regulator NarL